MAAPIRLIERGTDEQVREIEVTQPEFLIGRGSDCDLRLRVNSVSRHHCIIRQISGDTILVDLGSSNGSFLNGQRIRSQATLRTGDELQIGDCKFLVNLGDQSSSELGVSNVDESAVTCRLTEPLANLRPTKGDAAPLQ